MLEIILQLISDYGWVSIVGAAAIYIFWKLLVIVLKHKINNIFPSTNFSSEIDETVNNEIRFHTFFNNTEYRMMAEIPTLELCPNKPVRQQIFRDLLLIESKVIHDVCSEIIKIDMSDWSQEQWITELSKKVSEILYRFNKKCLEEGIPEIVLSKYNKWHVSNYSMLFDYVTILGNSDVYHNNSARLNTFLLIMNLMLSTCIADAERTLKNLNGEITGKIYKNMKIES